MKRNYSFVFTSVILFCMLFSVSCLSRTFLQKKPNTGNSIYCADFDGDKIKDTLKIIKNIKAADAKKSFVLCNPFDDNGPAEIEPIALSIKLSKNGKNFLIHDSSYFSTPSWVSGEFGIKIVSKGEKLYRQWKKEVKNLKDAAVVLGTEAGIDILLYWDKNNFKVFWPNEEP